MAKKPNRNAQRSIRLIEEAFVELLMEEPYDKITVTQIVNRADLNRGTFYAHFKDVDDLVHQISDRLAGEIMVIVQPMLEGEFYKNPLPLLTKIGDFIAERRVLFERLAATSGPGSFFSALLEKVRTQIREQFMAREPEKVDEAMVACDYLSAGMLWTCRSWVMGDFGDADISAIMGKLASLVEATSTAWTQAA